MKPILAAMLSVSGTVLTDNEKHLLEKSNPAGVTLFKRNIDSKEQVRLLVKSIKEIIGRDDVLIATDQEGGRVQRLTEPLWHVYAPQAAVGSLDLPDAKKAVQLHGRLIANDLHEVGINLDYAPVLDVCCSDTTPALKSRIFSDDENKVAVLGNILIDSLQENGVCACIKHLPGHGKAVVDPHFELPVIEDADLRKDFYPFITVAQKALFGMTGHIVMKSIDDKPVTQSYKAIHEIIRGQIGFKGFLISDAIDMHALKGSLTERTKVTLEAGCDAVCYCAGKMDELDEVIAAARPLTDDAYERLTKIKTVFGNKPQIQSDDYQQYCSLLSKATYCAEDYDVVESLNK